MFLRKLWNKKGKILKRAGLVLWLLFTIASTVVAVYNLKLVVEQQAYIEQSKQVVLEGAEASRRADQYIRLLGASKDEDALWVALNVEAPRLSTKEDVEKTGMVEALVEKCDSYFVDGQYTLRGSMQIGGAMFIEVVGAPRKAGEGQGTHLVLYVFVFRESEGWQLYGARVQAVYTTTWAEVQQTTN